MTNPSPRLPVVRALFAVVAMTVAACMQGAAGPSASALAIASPAPSTAPSPVPVVGPTPAASASPSSASACAVKRQTTTLPSDRLVDLTVKGGAASDTLTFVFGNPSLPGPATPPSGTLEVALPPFTHAGSGATIAMTGGHVVTVRFTGMSLQNDAGEETYTGPTEVKPAFTALGHAVVYDASEGVIGWYVGYEGSGCVTLTRAGTKVTLTIAHT